MSRSAALAFLAALLTLTVGAREAAAQPSEAVEVVAQDPRLVGTWEMVDGPVAVPRDDVEMTLDRMTLDVRPSGGDGGPTPHSFEVRMTQQMTMDGTSREVDATSWCTVTEGDVIGCQPSHDGDRTGYGGLGQYAFDGDVLTLGDPRMGVVTTFQRTSDGGR